MTRLSTARKSSEVNQFSECKLASNQRLIWLGQQRYPDLPLYEIPHVFAISGDVNAAAFQTAFTQWIRETETLRTVAFDDRWSSPLTSHVVVAECQFVDLTSAASPIGAAQQFINDRMDIRFQPTIALYDSVLLRLRNDLSWWLFRVHHVLTDGLNSRQILRSMSDCYRQAAEMDLPVSELDKGSVGRDRPQYRDFVQFESNASKIVGFEVHQDWWRSRSEPYAASRLYSDAASGKSKVDDATRHQRVSVLLNQDENEAIASLAMQAPFRQLTPQLSHFNILATALTVLLHRLEQRNDIRFGVTSHGRINQQFRETVGLFMQLLPFQIAIDQDDTISTLADKIAIETRGFLQHSLPGVMRPYTAKSFNVALNVLDLSVDDFAGMSASLQWLHNGYGDPGRQLTISAHKRQETQEWELLFDFCLASFSEHQQQQLISHFRNVLRSMTVSGRGIGSFPIVSADEQALLCTPPDSIPCSGNQTLWSRFVAIASRFPNHAAIHAGDVRLTYLDLKVAAEQLADQLADCGPLVPLLCRRDAHAVVGMMGILAADRCFLPIELDQPRARIDALIADCRSDDIIDASHEPRVIEIQRAESALASDLTTNACYVLYTSGSTGAPNGVVVGHDSVLNLLEEFERIAPVAAGNCAWWTNVSFDVAIYEIFSALLFGHNLCIPDDSTRNSATKLFDWMAQQRIASAYLPPFFLADFDKFLSIRSDLPLQRLLVGVEPIPQCLLASLSRSIPELKVINGYGPTEATVCATAMLVDAADDSPQPASIGRAVRGNVLRIVDRYDQLVPVGVTGELLIGGVGLAKGYLGPTMRAQDRFVRDIDDDRAAVWYRTGDLVCQTQDGNLHFRGRIDDQIKLRGHRVEPGEVLAAIRSLHGVHDASVLTLGEDGDRQLVAVVVGEISTDAVRSHVQQRLPRHLVPQQVQVAEQLPRTINGKPDIPAMRQMFHDRDHSVTRVAPRSPHEFTLLAVWKEVLQRSDFGVTENFFQLGGDSLDAMKVVAAAEQVGINLQFPSLFSFPTVRQLAAEADVSLRIPQDIDEPERYPSAKMPLLSSQRGLWNLAQVSPASVGYHLQVHIRISARLDPENIKNCFTKLVQRHEALRTTFELAGDQPVSIVQDPQPVEVLIQSVQTAQELDSTMQAQGTLAFDLRTGPLLRVMLAELPENESCLILTTHHIAVDQKSMDTLLMEFAQLYNDHIAGTLSTLPAIEIQASDFAKWKLRSQQINRANDLQFWQSKLAECSAMLHLPADQSSAQLPSQAGALYPFTLSETLSQQLRNLAKRQQVSVNVLMMTAFQILLHRYGNDNAFVIGVPVSQRFEPRFASTVGYLMDSMPMPCCMSSDQTFRQVLAATETTFSDCLQHLSPSLQEIVGTSENLKSWHGGAPFQAMFVMQQALVAPVLDGIEAAQIAISHLGESKFDLTLFVTDASEFQCMIEYRTDLFSPAAVKRIEQHWRSLLDSIVESPDIVLAELSLITREDCDAIKLCNRHSELLVCDSTTKSTNTSDPIQIQHWIETQAQQNPDAPAIVFDDATISYAVLDSRANKLAERLMHHADPCGRAVALCCDRRVEMIVGMLGILKAGAAYVPIDPNQPELRRIQILKDANAVAIVSVERFVDSLKPSRLPVLTETETFQTDARSPQVRLGDSARSRQDLAYVLYTSGSTGEPKGVEVSHDALIQSTRARFQYYDEAPKSFLLLSPIWFDSSVAGIFWTLCSGGVLVIPREDAMLEIAALATTIARHNVTHTLCLPSLYQLLIRHARHDDLATLQCVIVAGETCSTSVVADHFALLPKVQLCNEYGPTEATVWATVREISSEDALGSVSIGMAAPGSTIRLLDTVAKDVPIGVVGEVYIGGTRLAVGYRNHDDLTSERFLRTKSSTGERLYRTGDLAQLRADGSLMFLGRSDDQIKVHGQRIEPAEIEAVMSGCPGVREVAVGLANMKSPLQDDRSTLLDQLQQFPDHIAEAMLCEVERLETSQVPTDDAGSSRPVADDALHRDTEDLSIEIDFKRSTFVNTPRSRQRKWLLDQAMQETIADLNHLDQVAKRMVPGSDTPHLPRDLSQTRMSDQEIMEDWQTPLMQAMADYACTAHGDVLEIGFGRGVAASFIQSAGVRSHTIVEMNSHSIRDFFEPWQKKHVDRDIRLVAGRWQDVLDQLTSYDTVFFHAFPMNEAEFVQYIAASATFAEHFFPTAAGLLREHGVLTYLTTEIDSLSRRHQRSLFQHFQEIHAKVLPLSVPDDTMDAWWADSMVVVRAISPRERHS